MRGKIGDEFKSELRGEIGNEFRAENARLKLRLEEMNKMFYGKKQEVEMGKMSAEERNMMGKLTAEEKNYYETRELIRRGVLRAEGVDDSAKESAAGMELDSSFVDVEGQSFDESVGNIL